MALFLINRNETGYSQRVYAAQKPSVKEKTVTLYVNYKNYQIQFSNLLEGAKVTYKSNNKEVADVTKSGCIKPKKEGKAIITATIRQNNKEYSSSINVIVKEPYLNISNMVKEIEANSTYTFHVKAMGLDNVNLLWSSSNNQVGAINSKTGKFTAIMAGKTKIKVKDLNSGKTKSFTLEVIGEEDPDTFGFDIDIVDNEVIICGLEEEKNDVVIPDLIGGYPVTRINPWAFYGSNIKTITFGNNIKYIGEYAFSVLSN